MEKSNSLNPLSLKSILTLRYDPTLISPIRQLSWEDFKEKKDITLNSIENSISQNVSDSIKHLEQKKIVIALSGGIDSTLSLLYLKNFLPSTSIEAISVKFSDSVDETSNAKEIADFFDVKHSILYIDDYFRSFLKAIEISELPFWDIHWYYISEKASSISKFLVSGDGGDELFGGYTFRYAKFLSLISTNSTPLEKVKAYVDCHMRDHVPDQHLLFGSKTNFHWSEIYEILLPFFDNPLDSLEQVFLADFNGKLSYNFSIFNKKIMDSFNLTSITPLLSNELISKATKLSVKQKYDKINNVGKIPLRNILQKNNLNSLIDNQKLGFSINTLNLWKNSGYEICKQYLLDSRLVKAGWINDKWITTHINKKELDIRYVNKFLGLLAYEFWYRLFISKEMNSNSSL